MKSEKGITLIALVLTLIVLSILISIVGYSGAKTVNSAKLTAFTTDMRIMQSKTNELYEEYKSENNNAILNTGKDISDTTVFETLGIEDYSGYRYFDKETLKSLGLEEITEEFYVNIQTRDVISCKGIKYSGVRYYRLSNLPNSLYNVEYENSTNTKPTFNTLVESTGENEYKIKIRDINYTGNIEKWIVAYSKAGANNWTETDNYEFTVKTTTGNENYDIYLYNGDVKSENTTVTISNIETLSETKSYVGCYVDTDGDGTVDGVIFADLAVGGEIKWSGYYGEDSVPTKSDLKKYYISKTGVTTGITGFDEKNSEGNVVSVVKSSTGNNNRFYVLSLSDFTANGYTRFHWYNSAGLNEESEADNESIDTSIYFKEGSLNTSKMIEKWNAKVYGSQDDEDIWKWIQTKANAGWFIPSEVEWAAFGSAFGLTEDNYSNFKFNWAYWSSSQMEHGVIHISRFDDYVGLTYFPANHTLYVRLATKY